MLEGARKSGGSSGAAEGLLKDADVEGIADLLAAGDPGPAVDAIEQLAASLDRPIEISLEDLEGRIYISAARARMSRADLAEMLDELDDDVAADEDDQGSGNEEIFLQSVGVAVLPIAGLDVGATFHYTKVFMDNFPSFSLPLGDYDLRATWWLAQLMDMGGIRAGYRDRLRDLAAVAEKDAQRAAARLRAWADGPLPSDQTEDLPWMQGLLALARSQL